MWQHPQAPTWKLINLLQRCRTSQASDERDYIFAMTGLSIEGARIRPGAQNMNPDVLDPDYTEAPGQTYTRFARYMIEWGDGIKLLYSASQGRDTSDLPSWVPNWAARDMLWTELAP